MRARQHRLLLALAGTATGAALVAALASAGLGDSPPPEGARPALRGPLLPDLVQAVPSRVAVRVAGGRAHLVFASAVENVGAGPLLLVGERDNRRHPAMRVRQVVVGRGGGRETTRVPGTIRYVRSETHRHWHLLGFERYELRDARTGVSVGRDRKTGFCLGDRYDAHAGRRLPGEPAEAVFVGECGRSSPGILGIEQGISVGYGDDYVPALEGQSIDLTGLASGRYVLVHRANPDGVVRERRRTNNASAVLLELRVAARRGESTVRVLARCPGRDRCRSG